MLKANQIHLKDVQAVYSGAEGRLWRLLMGEQIHLGGLQSSLHLAEHAGVGPGQRGVDLCCALGAGMRFLLRFRNVVHMTGVDATAAMLQQAHALAAEEGFQEQVAFVEADVCATGLPDCGFDFVWGEDAWCYVEDKKRLIAEAVRLARSGGTIAFTDWMEGPVPMSATEASRYLTFMKFPSVLNLSEYSDLLKANGCTPALALNTGRFAQMVPLYLGLIEKQLTYDALKIIGFNQQFATALVGEMRFLQSLADDGKIIQGLIVAKKG
jgi:SAM-dependent methyltransferase